MLLRIMIFLVDLLKWYPEMILLLWEVSVWEKFYPFPFSEKVIILSEKFRFSRKSGIFIENSVLRRFKQSKIEGRRKKKEKSKRVSQVYESFWRKPGWRFTASLQFHEILRQESKVICQKSTSRRTWEKRS